MSDETTMDGEAELTPRERRLLEAVHAPESADEAPIDDGLLIRFRRGELDDATAASVAGRLARDPAARALLVAQAEAERGSDAMTVARVMSRQRPAGRRGWLAAGAAVAVALAAALALFVMRPTAPQFALDGPYGGVAESRGEETVSRTFVPGNRLQLFARPDAPLATPPGCLGVVQAADGRETAVDRRFVRVAPNGVCRLDAPVEALFPTFGRYAVSLVLLPTGSVPDGIPRRGDGIWLVEKIDYRSAELP